MNKELSAVDIAKIEFEFVAYLTKYEDALIPVFKRENIAPTKEERKALNLSKGSVKPNYKIVDVDKKSILLFYKRLLTDNKRGNETQFVKKELNYLNGLPEKIKNDYESQFYLLLACFQEAEKRIRKETFVKPKESLSAQGKRGKRKPDLVKIQQAKKILQGLNISRPTHKGVHTKLIESGLKCSFSWVKKHFKTICS